MDPKETYLESPFLPRHPCPLTPSATQPGFFNVRAFTSDYIVRKKPDAKDKGASTSNEESEDVEMKDSSASSVEKRAAAASPPPPQPTPSATMSPAAVSPPTTSHVARQDTDVMIAGLLGAPI